MNGLRGEAPAAPAADSADSAGSADFVQSFARGLAVIRAFDAEHPELTLTAVARPASIPPAPAPRSPRTSRAPGRGMLGNSAFTEMMLADLIPMIEKTYRALPKGRNRAMAGLSMGGMQTHTTAMANLDMFSHIGLFSGGSIAMSEIKDPAAFRKQVKVLLFTNGSAEAGTATSRPNAEELRKAGINAIFYESPRTAHEWLTWRRSLREFAPLLFR